MRKAISLVMALAMVFSVTACSGNNESSSTGEIPYKETERMRPDDGKPVGYQLEKPEIGEEIAVFITSEGVIKIRLFPDAAPVTVENFKGLIKRKKYDNLIFHRVIPNFMIQGGDPFGNGLGGASIWDIPFGDEFNRNLLNIRGSVSMANSGPDTNGSQFFINQAGKDTFGGWAVYETAFKEYKADPKAYEKKYGTWGVNMDKVTENVKNLYMEYGGNAELDGFYSLSSKGHTVFGQVFEGLDTVDKISKVKTGENDKPITAVTIVRAEIQTYNGEE